MPRKMTDDEAITMATLHHASTGIDEPLMFKMNTGLFCIWSQHVEAIFHETAGGAARQYCEHYKIEFDPD